MRTRSAADTAPGLRLTMIALGLAVAMAGAQISADAAAIPFDRGIAEACDTVADVDPFEDVTSGATHADAIGCLWAYGIVQGRFDNGDTIYDPTSDVTREQMASFVARMLQQVPGEVHTLPDPGTSPDFADADTISSAHAVNVDRLNQAEIVLGFTDDTFRPTVAINRAQMASFIARALEAVKGETLPRAEGEPFEDLGAAHRASIEKLTQIGVVQGKTRTTYDPQAPTTRAQMATMIARSLDYLVFEGYLEPLAFSPSSPGALLGVTEVDTAAHANGEVESVFESFDRVTFTIEGDGEAGWRVRYVDEAIAHGSGQTVEVDGEAILEVQLVGAALPPDLDFDVWSPEDPIAFGGDGIVEIVDLSVYEGQHQIFIGTTGVQPFTVNWLTDPQRVYIDVEHSS